MRHSRFQKNFLGIFLRNWPVGNLILLSPIHISTNDSPVYVNYIPHTRVLTIHMYSVQYTLHGTRGGLTTLVSSVKVLIPFFILFYFYLISLFPSLFFFLCLP